jgi:hypothetical protein
LIPLPDNVPTHSVIIGKDLVTNHNVMIGQPPYSPDLATAVFFLLRVFFSELEIFADINETFRAELKKMTLDAFFVTIS